MEKKYLRIIGIIAVVLTLSMLLYTMAAATKGQRSGSSGSASSASTASTEAQPDAQADVSQADPSLFPQQLAGMSIVNVVSGPDAIKSVSEMHGTDIQVSSAYIVTYQGSGTDQMIVWYSEAKNQHDADALFKAMDQKVPASKAFQNYKPVTVAGKEYKSVTSSDGMQHYYWVTGNRVMWVGIKANDPEGILKQVAPLY